MPYSYEKNNNSYILKCDVCNLYIGKREIERLESGHCSKSYCPYCKAYNEYYLPVPKMSKKETQAHKKDYLDCKIEHLDNDK